MKREMENKEKLPKDIYIQEKVPTSNYWSKTFLATSATFLLQRFQKLANHRQASGFINQIQTWTEILCLIPMKCKSQHNMFELTDIEWNALYMAIHPFSFRNQLKLLQ